MSARAEKLPVWAAPRWTWCSTVLAALLTLAVFLALPLLERMARVDDGGLAVRAVQTALPPPPPPAPPPAPPRPPEDRRANAPKPRLQSVRARMIPAALAVALGRPGGDVGGDFALDFPLAAELPGADQPLVFEISDVDTVPRAVVNLPPLYPPQARNRRVEGEVLLEFVVTAAGEVEDARVIESRPAGVFDQAALLAVRRWRFEPGTRAGQPVPTRVRQPLTFRLE